MKNSGFIIFFIIVLAIYTSLNYYIFIRGNQALQALPKLKIPYYIILIFLFLSFIISIFLSRIYPSFLSTIMTWIGSVWLGAMVYFILIILFWDLLRLINHFIPFFPSFMISNYINTKLYIASMTFIFVFIIMIAGYINATHPVIKELNIQINKREALNNKYRIVAVSDIHIGEIINKKRVSELVNRINKLEPDLVFFPGDIVDQELQSVLKEKSDEPLKNIKSKYGIYAITGNHEYIGGINESSTYIKSLNIKLLRDSFELINKSFYLIGREDRDSKRFSGIQRKSLSDILTDLNKNLPKILLDHQPIKLDEAEKNNIDFQISGHTHHGQLWPFNFITKKIYEMSWGYLKKSDTQYYVSSGYGTWGPPIRTGNKPEIVLINLILN